MEFENSQPNADASPVSSEPITTGTEQTNEAASAQAPVAKPSEDISQQFDERLDKHPRFREVIEQKNSFAKKIAEMERSHADVLAKLQALQQPQAPKAEDALLKQLQEANPEFASRFKQLMDRMQSVDSIESEIKAFKQQQSVQAAQNQFQSLLTEHKVPAEYAEIYDAMIRAEGAKNPKLSVQDLPDVFRSVHDRYSKIIDGVKRSVTESYVQSKTKDAKTPAPSARNTASTTTKEVKQSKDPYENRKNTVDDVLAELRAARNS